MQNVPSHPHSSVYPKKFHQNNTEHCFFPLSAGNAHKFRNSVLNLFINFLPI